MSFADLKRNSAKALEKLSASLEKDTQKGSYKDDRIWQPEKDSAGNAYALIRFLPPSEGASNEFVKLYNHGFKGVNGKWFIENCPTTIGGDCPVCSLNNELWNTGIESNKAEVRRRKRRLSYYANVYVISDPATPENEGQVKIFRFGSKIMDMIVRALKPEFPDEQPISAFDFWKGANFRLKVVRQHGQVNYDKSAFEKPSELMDGKDEYLERIWKQQHDLNELVSEDKFKSYDELHAKLQPILGLTPKTQVVVPNDISNEDDDVPFDPDPQPAREPVKTKAKAKSIEDDDDLQMYADLLNG